MHTKFISCLFIMLLVLAGLPALAQDVEMADTMRSEGKIYVVIAVILTILAGLIFYVWRLDRKITRLENENNP